MKPIFQIIFCVILISCGKSTVSNGNGNWICCDHPPPFGAIIEFGKKYNFCAGNECYTSYILSSNKLIRITQSAQGTNRMEEVVDSTKNPSGYSTNVFRYLIPDNRYGIFKRDTTFGCPDCADQGATIYRIIDNFKKDTVLNLTFDNNLANNPDSLQPFIKRIWLVMDSLKNK